MKCLEDLDVFHEILVPLDGSEYAEKALATAVQMAKRFNGTITLLHVYSLPILLPFDLDEDKCVDSGMAFEEISQVAERIREAGAYILARGEKTVEAEGIPVETLLKKGHVVQEIVKAAREGRYDLIVLGVKGRSKIKEMLLGSVSEKVIRNAPCTVMVAK